MNIIGCKFRAFMGELQDINPVSYHREDEFGCVSNLIKIDGDFVYSIPAEFTEVQDEVDQIFQIRNNVKYG